MQQDTNELTSKVPGFSWLIESELAGMKFPTEPEHYLSLTEPPFDIGVVICLNEVLPAFLKQDCFAQSPLQVAHFPIDDYGVPKQMETVYKIVDLVRNVKSSRKGVVVHCMAGLSRTGMVLSCLLVSLWQMSPKEAVQLVNNRRGKGRAVMTFKQEDFVERFYQHQLERLNTPPSTSTN